MAKKGPYIFCFGLRDREKVFALIGYALGLSDGKEAAFALHIQYTLRKLRADSRQEVYTVDFI